MSEKKIKWYHPKAIFSMITGFGLIAILLYGYFEYRKENRLLDKHGKYEIAVVTKKSQAGKKKYVHYKFMFNNKTYEHKQRYYSSYGFVKKGDKFKVLYFPEDPSINRLLYQERVGPEQYWLDELIKDHEEFMMQP